MDKKKLEEFQKLIREKIRKENGETKIMSDKFIYKEEGEIIFYPPTRNSEQD
ncbi:hypothetical protein [Parageobacillus thermoglucosidasius]|uniref:Uncharacterized protein n=1 Tax=Parageobacillus thermoglucosidasius TaxID=1426 RepID=A0AB38R352_PARTM|nr:hypothetical protein [Parageobacillus thermoglucosidasius]UOE77147.1 hypothetical protein IMI45_04630 [Parageobacillus thermoglucosidasius]